MLVTAQGEELNLAGCEVHVEVPVKAVSMSDDPDEGGACGNISPLFIKEAIIIIPCEPVRRRISCWMRTISGTRGIMSAW